MINWDERAYPQPALYDVGREQINNSSAYGADPGLSIQELAYILAWQAYLFKGYDPKDAQELAEKATEAFVSYTNASVGDY